VADTLVTEELILPEAAHLLRESATAMLAEMRKHRIAPEDVSA
jgi:hypothetical protein